MKILIIAEHDNKVLKPAAYRTVTAAQTLVNIVGDATIDIVVIGHQCQTVAAEASLLPALQQVLVADHAVYEHQLAENCAMLIAELAKDYNYILAPATTYGKNLLPRAAALLDVAMLSDVMQILAADTFIRPTYAGNVMTTVQMQDRLKVLTVRTSAFAAVTPTAQAAPIQSLSIVMPNALSHFEKHTLTQSKRPELTSARVVISGGRALKSAENFKLLENIADQLNAAIGASRAAVDAGFAPNDYQVGQTGKVVAPELYIAVGISGAIQHIAGMKDSKIVVAINNDPDAPVFQVADYAMVGDLFKILPELQAALTKIGK